MYAAHVADKDKLDLVDELVNAACNEAVKKGLFGIAMTDMPVVIGLSTLPVNVPAPNLGDTTEADVVMLVKGG